MNNYTQNNFLLVDSEKKTALLSGRVVVSPVGFTYLYTALQLLQFTYVSSAFGIGSGLKVYTKEFFC